jgi:Leucine-rich repeat (LRR) protein
LEGTLDPIYDKYLLQNLDLDGNSISGPIGAAFGGLTGLVDIEMSNNQLDGSIPVEIGNLINATELSISNNQLTGPIPEEIGNLTNLQILNLANNQLDTIPSTLSNLTNLQYLGLAWNRFEDEFPVDFDGWNALNSVRIANNTGMTVDVDAFADLGMSMNYIDVSDTVLTGNISSLSGLI